MFKRQILGGIVAFSLLAGSIIPSASFAQGTTDTALIQQLQAQIQSLLAQVQQLTSQISQLQGQQSELQAEIKELRLEARQLREGIQGEDVRLLQEILATDPIIYPQGLITGFFGPLTKIAVIKFQAKFGISQIGEVGPQTRAKINELLAEGAGKSGKVPPGLLIAPGIAKKLGQSPSIPEGQKLPPGIAKKLNGDNDDDDDDDDDEEDDDDDETDTTAPTIFSLSPADNATLVAVDVNLVLTFSENVVSGSGNVAIKKTSDDSVVEVVEASATTGDGTKTITVNPAANLAANTGYYVTVGADAFKDAAGNMFAGISDKNTWNFTTAP